MATILGDIEWFRGDSYPLDLTIKDKATGLAVDITGFTFLMTVNKTQNPTDDLSKLFQTAGAVDGDQVTNKGKVSFTPLIADTATAAIGVYHYDIQLSYDASSPRTIIKKLFTISQDITK